jgi:acetaldehyde dehydrogenase (acetylating)
MGHTMAIHSSDEDVILQFGLHKPAFRVIVNSPTTFGSIGMTTGLEPALTLGCGGFGGNITSDNITPLHLLNVKRLAYEVRPAIGDTAATGAATGAASRTTPAGGPPAGVDALTLQDRVGAFLAARGLGPGGVVPQPGVAPAQTPPGTAPTVSPPPTSVEPEPVDFVCEDDVRRALRGGKKIHLGARAIITPAARDLGQTHDVFVFPPAEP